MASYPTSVKSFTTKNTNDVIQAAHMNDVQDEVNAIEAGIVNGTARVVSSGLSVTGGSTFAVRPFAPPPDAALVFRNSTYAVASSANSTISWTDQVILTNSSMHSTGTNPERLTPQSTGLYLITAQIGLESASSGVVYGARLVDSSGAYVGQQLFGSTGTLHYNLSGLKRFDALGGYVTLQFTNPQTSSASLSSGLQETWFSLTKL